MLPLTSTGGEGCVAVAELMVLLFGVAWGVAAACVWVRWLSEPFTSACDAKDSVFAGDEAGETFSFHSDP